MDRTNFCLECNEGIMKKPFPAHSYDFNEDGEVIISCNFCGYGYREEIITPIGIKTRISNRTIKIILGKLCNRGLYFSYSIKKDIECNLNQHNNSSIYELSREIANRLKDNNITIDFSTIINTIYLSVNNCNCYT